MFLVSDYGLEKVLSLFCLFCFCFTCVVIDLELLFFGILRGFFKLFIIDTMFVWSSGYLI